MKGNRFHMQETERKFLVKNINNLNLEKYKKLIITQLYLYNDKYTTIRKRKIQDCANIIYYYTVKIGKNGNYSTEEIESEISKEDYESLKPTEEVNIIVKDRYIIPLEDSLKIELDIFHNIFEGIIFAEVEFPNEEMAKKFIVPKWFDKELTRKISNNKMSKLSKEEVFKLLEEI